MGDDERAAVREYAALVNAARPFTVRRARGWLWPALASVAVVAFGVWQASWLVSSLASIPPSELRMTRSLNPNAGRDLSLVALMLWLALLGSYQAMHGLRRLWTMRNPLSDAFERALLSPEIHAFEVVAVGVVMPVRAGDRNDEPWYLFDLGDASALLLHGPEFARTEDFPNSAFVYWRAPRGGVVVGLHVHGDRLVPSVTHRYAVRPEFLDSHDVVLEGPFDEVCDRVFERIDDAGSTPGA